MQINRLFEIVYILLNKKLVTAKELSEHFEVSQRTIYRDIETLSEAGIPVYANRGKGGGICLMEHFILNKSVLTKQEQNDILSALQGIQATSYERESSTLNKLSSLFQTENTDWIEVDFSSWNNQEDDRRKFTQLKTAILNRRVISFHYYNSYGQESSRVVEPLKLVFRAQAWYLYAFCLKKQSVRYFKITRMESLTVSEETFEPRPYDFLDNRSDLQASIEEQQGDVSTDPLQASLEDRPGDKSTDTLHASDEGRPGDGSTDPLQASLVDRPGDKSAITIHTSFGNWQGNKSEEAPIITLKVDASMAFRIYDEYPKKDVTRLEDGSFLIRSRMQPDVWLYGYLLSYEDHLEVLEPEYVRTRLAKIIENIKIKYII